MLKELLVVLYRPAVEGAGRPGLVEALGEVAALAVQRELLAHARALAGQLQEAGRDVVFAAEVRDEASRRELHLDGFAVVSQGSGLFGERIAHIVAAAFAGGVDRLAVLVTDCPSLVAADVDAVFAGLASADVVLVPSKDGGCILVGVSGAHAGVFDPKDADVRHAALRERAEKSGLRVESLPARWTVENGAGYAQALNLGLVHPPVTERTGSQG